MPRINFIPPPIDFQDRGTALVNPIMANAMQLAETFTTEIPRIRMQQEGIAEEKRRYEADQGLQMQERDYRRGRDTLGDQRYEAERKRQDAETLRKRFKDTEGLLTPDSLDLDGDGAADFVGGMTGRRAAAVKDPRAKAPNAGAWSSAVREVEQRFPTSRTTIAGTEDLAGDKLAEAMRQRREALLLRFGEDPAYIDHLSGYGVDQTRLGLVAFPPGEMPPSGAGGVGGRVEAGQMRMTPIYSDSRKMLALQALDSERTVPEADRVAAGGRSDQQIEQLKMQIMGSAYPGSQAEAPDEPVPFSMSAGAMDPRLEEMPPGAPPAEGAPAEGAPAGPATYGPEIDFDASAQRFVSGAKNLFASLLTQAQQALNRGDATAFASIRGKAAHVSQALEQAGVPTPMPEMLRDRGDAMRGADPTWTGQIVARPDPRAAPTLAPAEPAGTFRQAAGGMGRGVASELEERRFNRMLMAANPTWQ